MIDTRYWDSDCFLGLLLGEEDKADECGIVLAEAEAGRIRLVTSALTLAEVIKLGKGRAPIPANDAQKISDFFKRDYIEVRNLERYIAEYARQLVWDNTGVAPKDAIHVATALRLHLPLFNTFDGNLIALSGRLGTPPMKIERPALIQPNLPLGGGPS